jgi:23S rRNA (cytosine1962-C5)-methyltransferase
VPIPEVIIKPGREKPLRQKHPWVFSGAIHRADSFAAGEPVVIRDHQKKFLAYGLGSPKSQIRARVLSFDESRPIDADLLRQKLAASLARRRPLLAQSGQSAARIVMSEADLLPGLIVDLYGDYVVFQALSAGMERFKGVIIQGLIDELNPKGIIERSDDHARELEGLEKTSGLVYGKDPPTSGVEIQENGLRYTVDLLGGHKTGFYLDQRQNHAYAETLAAGKKVLDCFCYTGGFSLSAARGGAESIVSVDASQPALDRLKANFALNGFGDRDEFKTVCGSAFDVLRELKDRGETFDLIVLDPPKFAAHAAQIDKATRGYKDINLLAFKLLAPRGILLTYSCSGHISADLFQKVIFGAALDSGRDAQIEHRLFQADDHPVLLTFPESLYLKGLACRVL